MNRPTFLLIITCLLAASCTFQTQPKTASILADDFFSLNVPLGFQPTGDLHDYAQIQLQNTKQNGFIVGIREEKTEMKTRNLRLDLPSYTHFSCQNIASALDKVSRSLEVEHDLGGLPCIYAEIEGSRQLGEETLEVVYILSVIETENAWYQLVSWTDRENAPQMAEDMQLIACSFRELEGSVNNAEVLDGGAQAGE